MLRLLLQPIFLIEKFSSNFLIIAVDADFAYPLLHKKSSQNRCIVGQLSICSSHRLDLEHDLQPLPFCSSIPEGYRKLFVFVMFIILSSLVLHLLAVASQPVSQCHEDERLALFELKQSFKEGPEYCYYQSPLKGDYRKLESWKVEEGQEDSNCCTWSGVRCDEQTGHVVGLDLSSACLYGSINSNSSLFRLVHLENLNLAGNNFSFSTIPPEIGSLSRLTALDLGKNVLTGLLPSEYFNGWKAMRILNTSTLSYFGESWKLLLSPVQPVIDGKYEYSMTIISKGSVIVYSKILKYLTVIDLSSNNFNGEIPNSIGSLHGLYLLNLSNNHLTGHIPPALDGLTNLEALDLSCNELSGEIPQQLMELNSLAVFNVSYNQLSGPIPRVKQFNTFDNSSYRGNPGLCGDPLSNKCGGPRTSAPPPPPSMNDHEDTGSSLFELDWKIILMGFASGLVIGAVLGQGITIGRDNYFVRKFGPIYWRRRA